MPLPAWLQQTNRRTRSTARRSRQSRRADRNQRTYAPSLEQLERRLAPAITLSISNPAPFAEGDSGTTLGMFVVARSGDLAPAVQVDYATQDGTAHAGVDYLATSGTLSFASNQTTATIAVPIIANTIFQSNRTFTVALSNGVTSPPFAPQRTYSVGMAPTGVAVADFNGDGRRDLVVSNFTPNTVSVLLGSTSKPGAFAAQQTFPCGFSTGGDPFAVVVADFNGDCKPDIAVANRLSENVSVLLNTTPAGSSTLSFTAQQSFAVGIALRSLAVGDFNGDGKPDIAAVGDSNSVAALLNTTPAGSNAASFTATPIPVSSNSLDLAVADINGDGRPDLVVTHGFSGDTLSVLLNTTAPGAGTPSFAPEQFFTAGHEPDRAAVGDFNGDGKPDLAIIDYSPTGSVNVLLNQTPAGASTVSFTAPQPFASGTSPDAVAVGDFNGDGNPDLAVTNYNTMSVLFNATPPGATTATFGSPYTFATGTRPDSVAVGDFNGDGRPDLAVANGGTNQHRSSTVSVLLNTAQPVALSGSPATGTIQDDDAPDSIAIAAGNNQSANVNTAFGTNLAVDVRNAAGNLVQGVTVTFAAPTSGPSGTFGSSTSTMVVTDASGRATATSFTANSVAGSYMVSAQATGGSSPSTNFSLTNTTGAPTVTHFSVSGPSSVTAGSPFDVTVSALDDSNHVVTTYTGTIHFATSDGNHVLPPDYTFVPGDNGVHTFVGGVTLRTAGSQTVSVNDTVNTAWTGSATINVNPAAPDHLVFGQQPTDTLVNTAISPPVTVRILDTFNNLVTTDNTDQVTLAIGTNPGGGTLSGTNPVTVGGGVATFSNLSINQLGNGYTLTAQSGGISGATSASFSIVPPTTTIEGFESGNLSAYTRVGGTKITALVNSGAKHDGNFGLQDNNGADWIYRNDAGAHVQEGDRISVWMQLSTGTNEEADFGFGATSSGTLSIVAAGGLFQLRNNPGYNSVTVLGSVSQDFQANHWYRLQVDWGSTGNITGKLFDSDGTTLLNTVTGFTNLVTSGGIAFHASSVTVKWDTVQQTPGVDVPGRARDLIQVGLPATNSDASNPSYTLAPRSETNLIETRLLRSSAVVSKEVIDLARILHTQRKVDRFEARDALFADSDLLTLVPFDV
jgi:hypothetical protein